MKRYQTLTPDQMEVFLQVLHDARKYAEEHGTIEPKQKYIDVDPDVVPYQEWLAWAFEEVEPC